MRMLRSIFLLLAIGIVVASGWLSREAANDRALPTPTAAEAPPGPLESRGGRVVGLPQEAFDTLRLIEAGGPYPYDRDGTVFQNREGRLPSRPRGYYREYTVDTPGSPDRGARRLVTGGNPPSEFFYTDDHYRTFRQIEATSR